MHFNFDEKDKGYYIEMLKTEVCHNLNFYKLDAENRRTNIKKLEEDIRREQLGISECDSKIAKIQAQLDDVDGSAKRLLFREFKSVVSNLLSGEDSKPGGRFGLKIQYQRGIEIEKPVSIFADGKRHTETRQVIVTKKRDNSESLQKFQDYLRGGYNLPVDGLTFDQLKKAINEFFKDAPSLDIYGPEYEEEVLSDFYREKSIFRDPNTEELFKKYDDIIDRNRK